jgi:hypothetical protein
MASTEIGVDVRKTSTALTAAAITQEKDLLNSRFPRGQ